MSNELSERLAVEAAEKQAAGFGAYLNDSPLFRSIGHHMISPAKSLSKKVPDEKWLADLIGSMQRNKGITGAVGTGGALGTASLIGNELGKQAGMAAMPKPTILDKMQMEGKSLFKPRVAPPAVKVPPVAGPAAAPMAGMAEPESVTQFLSRLGINLAGPAKTGAAPKDVLVHGDRPGKRPNAKFQGQKQPPAKMPHDLPSTSCSKAAGYSGSLEVPKPHPGVRPNAKYLKQPQPPADLKSNTGQPSTEFYKKTSSVIELIAKEAAEKVAYMGYDPMTVMMMRRNPYFAMQMTNPNVMRQMMENQKGYLGAQTDATSRLNQENFDREKQRMIMQNMVGGSGYSNPMSMMGYGGMYPNMQPGFMPGMGMGMPMPGGGPYGPVPMPGYPQMPVAPGAGIPGIDPRTGDIANLKNQYEQARAKHQAMAGAIESGELPGMDPRYSRAELRARANKLHEMARRTSLEGGADTSGAYADPTTGVAYRFGKRPLWISGQGAGSDSWKEFETEHERLRQDWAEHQRLLAQAKTNSLLPAQQEMENYQNRWKTQQSMQDKSYQDLMKYQEQQQPLWQQQHQQQMDMYRKQQDMKNNMFQSIMTPGGQRPGAPPAGAPPANAPPAGAPPAGAPPAGQPNFYNQAQPAPTKIGMVNDLAEKAAIWSMAVPMAGAVGGAGIGALTGPPGYKEDAAERGAFTGGAIGAGGMLGHMLGSAAGNLHPHKITAPGTAIITRPGLLQRLRKGTPRGQLLGGLGSALGALAAASAMRGGMPKAPYDKGPDSPGVMEHWLGLDSKSTPTIDPFAKRGAYSTMPVDLNKAHHNGPPAFGKKRAPVQHKPIDADEEPALAELDQHMRDLHMRKHSSIEVLAREAAKR